MASVVQSEFFSLDSESKEEFYGFKEEELDGVLESFGLRRWLKRMERRRKRTRGRGRLRAAASGVGLMLACLGDDYPPLR